MRGVGWSDFLVGIGVLLMLEGIILAGFPGWMKRAMESTAAAPEQVLRIVGLVSAVVGLLVIWLIRQ